MKTSFDKAVSDIHELISIIHTPMDPDQTWFSRLAPAEIMHIDIVCLHKIPVFTLKSPELVFGTQVAFLHGSAIIGLRLRRCRHT